MKYCAVLLVSFALCSSSSAIGEPSQDMFCHALKVFVSSVKPGATEKVEFHTSWGGGFKGSPMRTIFEKRCNHFGYGPAKGVCKFLMAHGAIEFSGRNAMRAVHCLSPATAFSPMLRMGSLRVYFSVGSPQRGSNVTIQYGKDKALGGMVLTISAAGY